MRLTELNPTQRSVLIAIDHKQMSVMATGQALKIDRALAANLLQQLVDLGYAKKYENGQFICTPAGKQYLEAKLTPTAKVKAEKISRPKIKVELFDVDTNTELRTCDDLYQMLAAAPAQNLSENTSELLAMTPVELPSPDPIAVHAEAETTAIITQLQTLKPGLPAEIESSLLKLERILDVKPIPPMAELDIKLQVLDRLADLLHPTIAKVLDAIADDLQRVQQVAVDVSKAA